MIIQLVRDHLAELGLLVAIFFVALSWREARKRAAEAQRQADEQYAIMKGLLEQSAEAQEQLANAQAQAEQLEDELVELRRKPRIVNGVELPQVDGPEKCGNCRYFDLSEGQAQMRQYQPFVGATEVLTPAQMTRKREFDDAGNVVEPDYDEIGIPAKAKWSEFGACFKHHEGRWMGDRCELYERMEPEG